jgi:hypothetical protein
VLEGLESRALLSITVLKNFADINYNQTGNSAEYTPPDTMMAVGPTTVVGAVNTALVLKDKAGNTLAGPEQFATFFSSIVRSGDRFSDPYVLYDDQALRYYVGIIEFPSSETTGYFDFAVSNSSSPTGLTIGTGSGNWTVFAQISSVSGGGTQFPDFPKMGWNNDAVFVSFNQFSGSPYPQDLVLAISKASILAGGPLSTFQTDVSTNSAQRILIPARMHGSAAGTEYFAQTDNGSNTVNVVAETGYLTSSSRFATTTITVNPYTNSPGVPGLTYQIDDRMLSADWVNNKLVASMDVGVGGLNLARWYEFNTSGTPALVPGQQGDISAGSGVSTSYPSIAIDPSGDIGMTFIQSSSSQPYSMYITGRLTSDPAGTMQPGAEVAAGVLPVPGAYRGGDYSASEYDPVNTSQFWSANEYNTDNAGNNSHWGTQIAEYTPGVPPQPGPISDPGFEQPYVGVNNWYAFQYDPSGSPWAFAGQAGVAGNGSGFTISNPAAPQGMQVAFLQGYGRLSQTISLAAGSYSLSFMAAQRGNIQASYQTFQVLVDGGLVGTFKPVGTGYAPYSTGFMVAAGLHKITFIGVDPNGGDNTAFLDEVQISTASSPQPPPPPPGINDPGFETPYVGVNTWSAFQYDPSGSPWVFAGLAGVAGNGSGFTLRNPPAPQGTQVAFLQGTGRVNQAVSMSGGSHIIRFLAAQRGNIQASYQTFHVLVDGGLVATVRPAGTSYLPTTLRFVVAAGVHVLTFAGIDPNGGDNIAFVDQVQLDPPPPVIQDPGFETPHVGVNSWTAFQYDPSGSPWTFSGLAGVAGNGSGFTLRNPPAPQGTQVAFLQGTGRVSQAIYFAAGTYTVSFLAAQRANIQASYQVFQVLIDGGLEGQFDPAGAAYLPSTTNVFTVPAGYHTLTFLGIDPNGGDNTAFVDQVQINVVASPGNSIGSPSAVPRVSRLLPVAFQPQPSGLYGTLTVGVLPMFFDGDPARPNKTSRPTFGAGG